MKQKASNFTRLCNIAMDDNIDILDDFSENEITEINIGEKIYVVYATDELFSRWGLSAGQLNHVFVICFSWRQAFNVEQSLKEQKSMKRVTHKHILDFFYVPKRGTWSIKNANHCSAWNKGLKEEV